MEQHKHAIIIIFLVGVATGLLLLSINIPSEETTIVVTPSGITTTTPSPEEVSETEKPTPQPTEKPTSQPTEKPTPQPTEKPTSQPTEKTIEKPKGLLATKPEDIWVESQIIAGREDPFKAIVPPVVEKPSPPEEEIPTPTETVISQPIKKNIIPPPTNIEPGKEMVKSKFEKEEDITKGIILTGIIHTGDEPIAIITVDNNSQIVKVGETLRNNITVVSINYNTSSIKLVKGTKEALLNLREEKQ